MCRPLFETRLLRVSGVLPDPESLPLSSGARLSLQQILKASSDQIVRLRLGHAVEGELGGLLQGLFRNVLDRELKSRTFLYALGLERPVEQMEYASGSVQ